MMTRTDYELIASMFAEQVDWWRTERNGTCYDEDEVGGAFIALRDAARGLATKLKAQNPRFDEDRFLAACSLDLANAHGPWCDDGPADEACATCHGVPV